MTLAWRFKPPVYQVDILNTIYDMMISYQLPRSPEESMKKKTSCPASGEWGSHSECSASRLWKFTAPKISGTQNWRGAINQKVAKINKTNWKKPGWIIMENGCNPPSQPTPPPKQCTLKNPRVPRALGWGQTSFSSISVANQVTRTFSGFKTWVWRSSGAQCQRRACQMGGVPIPSMGYMISCIIIMGS